MGDWRLDSDWRPDALGRRLDGVRRLARPRARCADELRSLLHTSILSCASNQLWCKQ